jgi:aminoglycoside phosphotransferase (APT) family kinase protein
MTTGPAAAGVRVPWAETPRPVRAAVAQLCGAPVVAASTQPGGFSPGVAARVQCADGTRWFVKAVSSEANPDSPRMHRREGRVLAALDPLIAAGRLPVPRLRGVAESGTWVALVLADVDGAAPALPWQPSQLALVIAAIDRLASTLTPAPVQAPTMAQRYARVFTGWRELAAAAGTDGADRMSADRAGADLTRLDPWSRAHVGELAALEATWEEHAAGGTLLHSDLRADNLLLGPDGVVVVDWPHACLGAPFVDLVLFAPSVAMQGGPQLPELLALSRHGRSVPRGSLTAVLCALAGYFTRQALLPPPPGLPTLRAFQAAQGAVARRWLAELI